MASQLHEAVRLAQAGQRDDARRLLRQVVQSDPNNEMAWLWLASVAADQVEYERALTEVLRVNPGSQQARDLLTQFRQQYRKPPQQTPPPQAPVYQQTPPPQPSYQTPPPQRNYQPPEVQGAPYYAPAQGYTPAPAPTAAKRAKGCGCSGCGCGGCGCIPGCLLLVLLLILIPLGAVAVASVTDKSLGPLDPVVEFLPGDAGRKVVTYTAQPGGNTVYDVSATVPRGWVVASDTQSDWWTVFISPLQEFMPLTDASLTWEDLGNDTNPLLLEISPMILTEAGNLIGGAMQIVEPSYVGIDSFTCEQVRPLMTAESLGDMPAGERQVIDLGNGLCGIRVDVIRAGDSVSVFENIDPPTELRDIVFFKPIDEERASFWEIGIAQSMYSRFSDDIEEFVETVEVKEK